MGSQPYWPIFWLLPWAVINGSNAGLIMGLILGLILDSINNDLFTQIPGLMVIGFWFGKIGNIRRFYLTPLQYGLTASVGTFVGGLIYLVQLLFNFFYEHNMYLAVSYGIKNLFAQVLLTGLLAPVFCFWLSILFSRKDQLKL
tara:strand:- start:223 stop:651 length:429 start_codon:yes stop_codon:yes gene_type:complete